MPEQSTIDSSVRDALLSHTADGPPMPFTADDVIRAGRRSRRWHRAAVAAGAGLTVAALAAAAMMVIPILKPAPRYVLPADVPLWTELDPTPFCDLAAAPVAEPEAAPTTVVSPKNGFPILIPTEPPAHASARFSCYLLAAVPDYLPGASFALAPLAPDGTVPLEVRPGRVFDPDRPLDTSPPYLVSEAVITDAGGVGSIGFSASPAYESADQTIRNCTGECTVRYGPDGEIITVLDIAGADPQRDVRLVNILVYDGETILFASAMNGVSDPVGPFAVNPPVLVGRDDLPISIDALIEILLASDFTLFP